MSEFTLDDTQQPDLGFTISDETDPTILSGPALDRKLAQTHYALGDQSPGVEQLRQQFTTGGEHNIRYTMAKEEDRAMAEARAQLLASTAQSLGASASRDDMELIRAISEMQGPKMDPKIAVERRFAQKLIDDAVFGTWGSEERTNAVYNLGAMDDVEAGIETITNIEYFRNAANEIHQEIQKQSWGGYLADFAGTLLPYVSWWRQKQALEKRPGIELLQGRTMRENISYLWTLDGKTRREEFDKAMTYLRGKNLQEALMFAQAMVAFGSSDEFLANAVTLADYSTAGSFAGKLLTKVPAKTLAGKAAAGTLTPEDAAKVAANPEQVRYKDPVQLELFPGFEGRTSDQYTQQPRMLGWAEQTAPNLPPRGKGGRILGQAQRSVPFEGIDGPYSLGKRTPEAEINPNTGVYRGQGGRFQKTDTQRMRQQDLPLDETQPAQGDLFSGGGAARPVLTEQQKYEVALAERPVREVRQLVADTVKAMEDPNAQVENILSMTGRVQEAAVTSGLKRAAGQAPLKTLDDLKNELPTFAAPGSFYQESSVLHREAAQRFATAAKQVGDALVDTFQNAVRGARITPEALQAAKVETERLLRQEYGQRFQDRVVNIRHTPAEMHPANVDTLTMVVGKEDALPFPDAQEAAKWQKILGLEDAGVVRKQGSGYFIEIDKHIGEANNIVRDNILTLDNTLTTNSFKMFANNLLSAATILPKFQMEQRVAATHGMQELRNSLREVIHEVFEKGLSKKERQNLGIILEINRDVEFKNGKRGMWYQTARQFEEAYFDRFNQLPSTNQVRAYDTYRRLNDLDYLIRNATTYRDKAIKGVEQHGVAMGERTVWFEGVRRDAMPWVGKNKDEQDAGVWIYDGKTGQGRFKYMFDFTDEEKKAVDEMLKVGGRVVQVFDPQSHPLKGVAKTAAGDDLAEQVNYVISTSWQHSKPLDWRQVEYNPGPHVMYKHNWYVAGPNIKDVARSGKQTYFGDIPILNVSTRAEAVEWAKQMNIGRKLLQAGDEAGLAAHVGSKLPFTVDEFKALFTRSDSPLSLGHNIEIKEAGRKTIDTVPEMRASYSNGNLVDATKNRHDLAAQMDNAFLQERDHQLYNIIPGPKPRLEKAPNIDPYTTLNRAFSQALRNTWLNDYKIGAVERWIEQGIRQNLFEPSADTMRAFPTFFLHNPQWRTNVADRAALAAAKAEQMSIINFIGTRSELSLKTDMLATRLQDTIFNTFGQGKVLNTTLEVTADPVNFLRSVAFHTKLGLFNPVQFFVQSQALAHSIAIAGVENGTKGVAAAVLARSLHLNPKHLDFVASRAEAFGWKASEFKEYFDGLQRSGLYRVGGEATLRNDVFDPSLFRSTLGHFVFESGAMFFNEGERLVRLTAFGAAYREWKAANPAIRLSDRELTKVMNRADLLSVNMTRASNAAWQEGVFSIPTQFWAFNARMMEQMIGKRLTPQEKFRAFVTYSALYGLPAGIGVSTGAGAVWPVYDSFREYAFKNDIKLNDGLSKAMSEGLVTYAGWLLTGRETNFTARMSPGNNTMLRDALFGDQKLYETVLGAGGSILGDILYAGGMPLLMKAAEVFGADDTSFPMTHDDWLDAARNISSADLVTKAYFAIKYGEWRTKSGMITGAADTTDAILAAAGLTNKKLYDLYLEQKSFKSTEGGQKKWEDRAILEYRRAMQEYAAGNYERGDLYTKRAAHAVRIGDFNFEDQARILQRAAQSTLSLSDTIDWSRIKRAPASKMLNRIPQE
jgi:hypothetical protein